MHKVAEPPAVTFAILILTATGFPEISDRGKLRVEWSSLNEVSDIFLSRRFLRPTCIPAIIQVINGCLCLCFPFVASIHVSDQMVTNIIANLNKFAM